MPATPTRPKQARAHATRRRLLDAAVDELLDRGYAGLTTPGVAQRAGVSRGAQQNYFPHKATLVVEAVAHLGERATEEFVARVEAVPAGRARVEASLDALYEAYSGPLFAAVVEVSLAARRDADMREVLAELEAGIARAMRDVATRIFGDDFAASADAAQTWSVVLGALRGIALLKLLGHPAAAVDHQWAAARPRLLALLA